MSAKRRKGQTPALPHMVAGAGGFGGFGSNRPALFHRTTWLKHVVFLFGPCWGGFN